jgi:hypothetical protein
MHRKKPNSLKVMTVALPVMLGGAALTGERGNLSEWWENTRYGYTYDPSEIRRQPQMCMINDPSTQLFELKRKFEQKSKYQEKVFWQRPEVFEPFEFEENESYSERVELFVSAIPDEVISKINQSGIPIIISGYAAQNAKEKYGISYADLHSGKTLSQEQMGLLRRNKKNNYQVASDRAHFVRDLLKQRGVSEDLLEVYNYGEANKKEATVRICGGGQPLLNPHL